MSPERPFVFEPATRETAPSLLLLHGTGGNEHELLALARGISPGSGLLSPRGLVSERGAARFFPRLAEGAFDPVDVARHVDAFAGWLRAQTAKLGLSGKPLLALGYSNGANTAAVLMQRHPGLIAGGVFLRAMVVLEVPARTGTLLGTRVLLLNGDSDPIVPVEHPQRLASLLEQGGASVERILLQRTGHGLTPQDVRHAQRFFEQAA
jgi:phospholipase/carboxylesterase